MAKLKANKPTADVLMNSMRAMGYSFEAAIADIVDNSVSAQARNIVLRFPIDPSDCCVAVCDDGIGMNKKELLDAMKYGSQLKSANRSEDDLGRFGLGMKAASLSQCRRLTVASKKDCKLSAYVWDLDVIEEKKDWYMVDCSKEQIAEIRYIDFLSDKESGTIVLWENFDLIEKSSGNVYAELGKHQNATAEYLKQFHAWYVGPEEKSIWLTFDAGYENGYTEEILNVLKEEKVPAAFFLVGNYITENPDLVNRMVKEGHIVGNHTMHHPDMSEISEKEAFQKELADLETAFQQVTGAKMKKYYRPPQGKYSEANLKMADELGYTTIFWSLAYVDWLQDSQPTREEALNVLNRRIHPGAIVLLHSTSKTNSQILQELIQGWKKEGYVFRSLEELK